MTALRFNHRRIKAAKGNRHSHRNATMVLVAYRHGLRVSQLVDLMFGMKKNQT
jgi:hypothetical protein